MGKECYIVDETGEVLEVLEDRYSLVKLAPGDRVISKNSREFLKDTTTIKFHFLKLNDVIFKKYATKFSILPILMCYVRYLDNVCVYRNGKIVTPTSLVKVLGVSRTTIYRQLLEMEKEDLIHRIKVDGKKSIIINPYLCHRGKRISMYTYQEFIGSPLRSECDE